MRDAKGRMVHGCIPHNKGKECIKKLKKIQLIRLNEPVKCKKHGLHTNWRIHTQNNAQCKICIAEWQRERKIKNPLKLCLIDARQHSKKNNRKFDIDEEYLNDILNFQGNKCSLSGIEFNENILPSIDRVDSSKGYERGNIQILTIEINRMKSNLSDEKFIDLCNKVTMYQSGVKKKK